MWETGIAVLGVKNVGIQKGTPTSSVPITPVFCLIGRNPIS